MDATSGKVFASSPSDQLCYDARVIGPRLSDGNRRSSRVEDSDDNEDNANPICYVTRLSHLFPPDLPSPDTEELSTLKLRPEFVAAYAPQSVLNPNAFRLEMLHDDAAAAERSNQIVVTASQTLLTDTLPAFTARLDHLELCPLTSSALTDLLHTAGINIRYLGQLAQASRVQHVRQLLTVEMVARACKSLFRTYMCTMLQSSPSHTRSKVPVDAQDIYKEPVLRKPLLLPHLLQTAVIDFCNLVLGSASTSVSTSTSASAAKASSRSTEHFLAKLTATVATKFHFDLTAHALASLHKPQLCWALQHHLALELSPRRIETFHLPAPLTLSDFHSLVPVSSLCTNTLHTCDTFVASMDTQVNTGSPELALLALKFALSAQLASTPSTFFRRHLKRKPVPLPRGVSFAKRPPSASPVATMVAWRLRNSSPRPLKNSRRPMC